MANRIILICAFIFAFSPIQALPNETQSDLELLEQFATALEIVAKDVDLQSTNPSDFQALQDTLKYLRSILGSDKSMMTMSKLKRREVGEKSVFRRNGNPLEAPLQCMKLIANNIIRSLNSDREKQSDVAQKLAVMGKIQSQQLDFAQQQSAKRFRNYQIKYGLSSAQLNVVETLVNWGLQSAPLFGVSKENGPGPLEFAAAYSSSYLLLDDITKNQQAFSLIEIGLRYYIFKNGFGKGKRLKPAYFSAGIALAPKEPGILKLPHLKRDGGDIGVFISWGDVKFAYINGDDSSFLVSKHFQFIPLAF